jgi:CxxC-x17-CxxC domain-containing protein
MKDFKGRGGFGGDRGGFKKPGFKKFNDRNDRGGEAPRQMHPATCSSCGARCEVPFRPSADKEVFCNNCFNAQKEQGSGNFAPKFDRGFDKSRFDRGERRDFGNKRDFAPTARPVEAKPDRRIDELKAQVADLNTKLDQVIAMMTPAPKTEKVSVAKAPAKKKAAAKKKK